MPISDWLVYPVNLTPHGYCLLWAPGLLALHGISDIVIGIAYFSIPLTLAWFAQQRKDLEFRWVVLLFVGFILACGLTHFMSVYTLYVAAYGLEGLIKAITAALSVATAALLWPLIPKLLAMPSPAQLAGLNTTLSLKVEEQERTYALLRASEEQVRQVNAELEERVALRTADLTATNQRLEQTLAQLDSARVELEATVVERTEALKQRDLLLREVYHRVKNNLQIVDSVILMQANDLQDAETKAALEALRNRIYAIGLVHQQLMTSNDLGTFDLAPFIRELSENLVFSGAQGDIALAVEAYPLRVDLDFAVPMGLIVTELITNSLKHAFAQRDGKLMVSVARSDDSNGQGEIIVTVADNGSGIEPGKVPPSGNGIGKRLVDGLLRQLRGRMEIDGTNGMTTRLFLPQPRTSE